MKKFPTLVAALSPSSVGEMRRVFGGLVNLLGTLKGLFLLSLCSYCPEEDLNLHALASTRP
jgi:hypothetical protein